MKKESKVSVYNLGGQPAGEISPEEIEYTNDPAQPTSRCLSGSSDPVSYTHLTLPTIYSV